MILLISLFFISFGEPWVLLSPKGVVHDYPQRLNAKEWLVEQKENTFLPLHTDMQTFIDQCRQTRAFLEKNPSAPLGMMQHFGYTNEHRIKTLTTIIKAGKEHPDKLKQPSWWHTHFRHFVLHNRSAESNPTSIRLTKYVVYQVKGSLQKSSHYNHALWGLKKNTPQDILHRYSRISILHGVLETKEHASPLVWLTKNDALEAQMQGTIEVEFPNSSKKLFNVHRHNNMPYKKGVHSEKQDRYWYFREVTSIYGWGSPEKVPIQKDVSFAGDVDNLGFGSMIRISSQTDAHLGLIVDTGGAFTPNLGQFDWFIGIVKDKEDFYRKASSYPTRGQVEFLLLRE